MPNVKKDHEACRRMVCAICWCESGQKASRGVSASLEAALKDFVVSSYSRADPRFPTGLCTNCNLILTDWTRGVETPRPLPVASKYEAVIPLTTRSSPHCTCTMCKLASLNGAEWKRFSSSKKQQKVSPISKQSGEKLCGSCFSRIYRGSNHSADVCKSSRTAVENLSGVSSALLDKLVHQHLKAAEKDSGDTTIEITSVKGGKPMLVTIGQIQKEEEVPTLTCEEVLVIQNEASLSDK